MNKKIIFLLILLSICAVSHVSAADDNATEIVSDVGTQVIDDANHDILSTPVEENEIISSDDGSYNALQDKINKASPWSTINLQNDYDLDGSELIINKPLTINGNGKWIESQAFPTGRLVTINSSDVTLNNISFSKGHETIGGAILGINPTHTLTITNCYFYINSAYNFYDPFVSGDRLGSAIYWPGKLILKDCTFNGNSDAGAVVCGAGDVDGCEFRENGARNAAYENLGGAITCRLASTIKNSYFYYNKADNGGAIYGFEDIKISNCYFKDNVASKNGSAIYLCKGNLEKSIINCDFNGSNIKDSVFILHEIPSTEYDKKDSTSTKTQTTAKNNVKTTLTLKTVKVKKSAKQLVLTATLKKGKSPIKNKKVTFKFNGKKYKVATNKNGVAKLSISKKLLKKLKVGKKVKYQVSYGKLSVKKSAKVKK